MLSLRLTQSQGPRLLHLQELGGPATRYYREALKAFKKFVHEGKEMYTCNVKRLQQCNRLGTKKQISLWRTHFFLCSPHFDLVTGVVFNAPPGQELAGLSLASVDSIFVVVDQNLVNIRTGRQIPLGQPLVFASAEKTD